MKKLLFLVLPIVFITLACAHEQEKEPPEAQMPAGTHKVVVKEKTDAAGYSYLFVEENGKEYWIAVRQMPVNTGDEVYYSGEMEMKNFQSTALNKTFDSIFFVQNASTSAPGQKSTMPPHPPIKKDKAEKVAVQKVEGGVTVADVYKRKKSLDGKSVKISGKVVKFNPEIMGRNWIHIQDGTDFEGKFDLLVTTDENVKVGEVVTIEGVVAVNTDVGAGYSYEVMLENGKIIK